MAIDPSYTMRLSGLATGLDTDSIIENLMNVEKIPITKLESKKQIAEWKRDDYRDIISKLSSFKSEFLDVLSSTNMRSAETYKKFNVTTKNTATGNTSTAVSATGSKTASAGNHTITVNNIAKAEEIKSSRNVTSSITGNSSIDWASAVGKNFVLSVDGTSKKINLDSLVADGSTEITQLENILANSFGEGKIDISTDASGYLEFNVIEGSGVNKLTIGSSSTDDAMDSLGFTANETLSNRISTSDTLEEISSSLKNTLTFDSEDNINLIINDEEFTFSKTTTLKDMISEINNNENANVTVKYDELSDKLKIISKQKGQGTNINLEETDSNFLSAFGFNQTSGTSDANSAIQDYSGSNKSFVVNIDGVNKTITLDNNYTSFGTDTGDSNSELTAAIKSKIETAFSGTTVSVSVDADDKLSINLSSGGNTISFGNPESGNSALSDLGLDANYTLGEDAEAILDGEYITRTDNSFTVEGITYTLLNTTESGEENISLSQDVDKVFDNIVQFIGKYNDLYDEINTKIDEEYDRNYQPLTDEQKESMSETDAENWEKKAKTGLLRNDYNLEKILTSMRQAVYEPVENISSYLSDIGISTGSYSTNGKLIIDETKLKEALQNDTESVMNIFSQESTTHPGTTTARKLSSSERTVRYEESGIAFRLFDIIEDNISIISDSNGNKGSLLEKAGQIGDASEYDNTIYNQIKSYNTEIEDLYDKLYEKEDNLYSQYAALEKAISQMNSQSSWFMSQMA